jgi:uncharacterized protein
MKHIDAHIHMYPEKLMNAIYLYFAKLGWQLPFNLGVEDALKHLQEHNVEKAFLLLYAHKKGMSMQLNQWAHALCLKHPHLIPFGCYFPEDDERETIIRNCLLDWNFAGFKLHFNVQKYRADDPLYFPVYQGAVEYGKGVIMHIGTFPNAGEHLGASRLAAVMEKYPQLKVMVAHMGFYQTDEFWRIMDSYPGVYLDTAFILGNPSFYDADKIILETMERFPDRVLYGSDFPLICHSLQDGLSYIDALPWDNKLKENLLYNNAVRFLKPGPS